MAAPVVSRRAAGMLAQAMWSPPTEAGWLAAVLSHLSRGCRWIVITGRGS